MTAELVAGALRRGPTEFEQRVMRASAGLRRLGIGEDDVVALILRNDIPMLEAMVSVRRLGAYPVPINWHFEPPEVAYILEDSGAKAVIAHTDLYLSLSQAIPRGVPVIAVQPSRELLVAYGIKNAPARVSDNVPVWETWLATHQPDDRPPRRPRATMAYTSGTTGRPKGVRRPPLIAEHLARISVLNATVFGATAGARTICPAPLYHSAPNVHALSHLDHAELMVIMPRFDAESFLALVQTYRISHAYLVPIMFIRLLRLPAERRSAYDVSSLRFVLHGAGPCPPSVKRAMIEWWGPVINEFYGGSEVGPVTLIDSHDWLRHPGSVGRPLAGAGVAVVDANGGPLPAGQEGQIFVRQDAYPDFVYHNAPAKRAAIERNGMITMGDMGRVDEDGYLYLGDRGIDMAISGGVNIYPAEIEAVLITMPGVADCAVFAVPDEEFGEALVAVVEPANGFALSPQAVRDFLRGRLAGYKIPRVVEIGADLPREDSGKIFKRHLRDAYRRGATGGG